ncbi:hypothetical protein SRHO_G00312910 [Serrasalmus rhombeus]
MAPLTGGQFCVDPTEDDRLSTIPSFASQDPNEFAHLKIALKYLRPVGGIQLFKNQALVDHLKLKKARLIADAYLLSPTPQASLHHSTLERNATVVDSPDIRPGDTAAFEKFVLQIQSLVGMLQTLGPEGQVELQCGLHVAPLLSELPPEQRAFHHYACSPTHRRKPFHPVLN